MAHTTRNHPPNYPGTTDTMVASDLPDLPTYSPRRFPAMNTSRFSLPGERTKIFEYNIKNRGKLIASLTLLAQQAFSKHIPTFVQGSPVKGRVYLCADKIDSVRAITVAIQGRIIAGADPAQQQVFLDIKQTIWSSADGVPSRTVDMSYPSASLASRTFSSSTSSNSGGADPFEPSVRHRGHSWDFSVTLPSEVSVTYGRSKQMGTFSLPETFTERLGRASIAYEISVLYSKGKWQTDYSIPVLFGYIPLTRPSPFSPLRQLSYQENAPLLGPTVDMEGWQRVKEASIQGTLFNARNVDIRCTLFLAKPLSYTRGSSIPLWLCLAGEDQHGLDLLSAPKAIDIRLGRRVRYHYDAVHTVGVHHLRDSIDFFDRAVLWPSNEGVHDPSNQLRFLNGELHIKSDAKPTSAVGDFRIEYSVLLLAFEAPGFEPLEQKPLAIQPVDIVSAYAPGPRPKNYAPPGYEVPEMRRQFVLDM